MTLSPYGPSWLALEPRIMFDGAGFATLTTVVTDPSWKQSPAPDDATTENAPPESAPTGEPQFNADDQALFDALAANDASRTRQEVIFVSASVRDYQQLLDGISPNAEVHVLDADRDGVQQMAEVLGGGTGIDAIHIISHGSQAELTLGAARLTLEAMNGVYAEDLAAIGRSLSDNADLLIYGCNFGQGDLGGEAADRLAQLTGADVAASVDLTGHADLGGDWDLEYSVGSIETGVAFTSDAQQDWGGLLMDLTSTGEFRVNDPSGNDEQTSGPVRGAERAVDIAPNSDYVVVWTDETASDKVYAKVLDKDGNEKVAQFQVNTGGGNNQWADVAVDDSGNFVVTWTRSNDVYMRRFMADGTAVDGADVQVNTTTPDTQENSSVNLNGAGDFVIAWEGDGGGNEGIFVRSGSFGGGLTGSEIAVDTAAAAQDPSVGIADSGDFVVVWDDGSGDVFFQQYDNAGAPQTSGQVDVALQFSAGGAAVDMGGDGRFTVAYRATGLGLGAYVRQFNAAGTPLFLPQLGNTTLANDQTNPSVSMDDSGDFIVVWEGEGNQAGNVDADGVFGQKFDSTGAKIGGEFLVNQTTANVQDRASVAMLDRNKFVVVWTGSDGSQTDVFARQYSSTPPTLDLDANDSSGATGHDYRFTFTEGDGPTAIADSDADLSDVDSTTFDHVTLSISGLLDGNAETLVLDGDAFALATTVAGQDTIGGNYRVVVTTGAGTATVTITKQGGGTFTEAETETLIKAIQYQHTDTSTPTDGDRLVDVTVNDGTTDSTVSRTTINVNPVNDAPVVSGAGGTLAYTEGDAATVIDGTLTVSDVDDTNIESATVSLTGGLVTSEDVLALTSAFGITGSYSSATGILSLSGTATLAQYEQVLESVTYANTNTDNPNTGARVVTWIVNDGSTNSAAVTSTITVAAVNDASVITSNGGGPAATVTVLENVTVATTVTSSDVDGGPAVYSIVPVGSGGGADAASFTINSSTGVLSFVAAPDYEVPTDVGADNIYEVTVQVSDGNGGTPSQALSIMVTDVAEGLPPIPPPPEVPPSLVPQSSVPPPVGEPPPVESSPLLPPTEVHASISSEQNPDTSAAPFVPGTDPEDTALLSSEVSSASRSKGVNTSSPPVQFMREMRSYVEERFAPLMRRLEDAGAKGLDEPHVEQFPRSISEAFRKSLGIVEEDLRRATDLSESNLKFSVGVTNVGGVGLTAGVITWLLRSGALLASLAASLPAWRHFDPLPVVLTSERVRRRSTADTDVAADRENKQFRGLRDLLDRKGHNGGSKGDGGEG